MKRVVALALALCLFFSMTVSAVEVDSDVTDALGIATECPEHPLSVKSLYDVYTYQALTGASEITLIYKSWWARNLGNVIKLLIKSSYSSFYYGYPEYSMYTKLEAFSVTYGPDYVKFVLRFHDREGCTYEDVGPSLETVKAIYDGLVEDGSISPDMSERDRALVLLKWVAENLTYQNDGNLTCTTPAHGLENGYGTCGTYTGIYNLLLRLDGIECYGRGGWAKEDGIRHVWTVADLDGVMVNIDATWCDKKDGTIDMQYFAQSDEVFAETHIW